MAEKVTIGNADLWQGDCLEVMAELPPMSVDAVITDPPYGLSFMGKRWDYDVPSVEIWAECLRVLKPGGHLLAFAGTRTQHRMAVRIEDAGFEIRDMLAWLYGSGFPKSHDVSKAIDAAAGAEREVVGNRNPEGSGVAANAPRDATGSHIWTGELRSAIPITEAAKQWDGWGTALKPALEPITMARKPLAGTVAANVLAHGTGALNIDGCRVGDFQNSTPSGVDRRNAALAEAGYRPSSYQMGEKIPDTPPGRWPANLIHDDSEEVLAHFPDCDSGTASDAPRGRRIGGFANIGADSGSSTPNGPQYGDTGSAARFFMQCKGDYNDAWQDLNLPQENANTAEQGSSQQRQAAVSALVLAVSSALPEGLLCSGLSMAPFTSATANELRLIAETATQTIQSIDSRFWHESKPARLSLSLNHASDAEIQRLTDTTTITVSRWKSDGSAEPVTFSITQKNLEVGEKDCAPSMDGKRFIYCAKASKADRDEGLHGFAKSLPASALARTSQLRGEESTCISATKNQRANVHPTVKPTDLMRYLLRLVTPPGGTALDPFMGSGSTGKAALLEHFKFIGIERDPDYLDIAKARIDYIRRSGVQVGLFGEAA